MATESKRDKKRREIIEKVEKQHAEKIQNFQQIYSDITTDLNLKNQALLRDPSTSVSLQAPMYMLSLERDAWLDSIDTQYEYKLSSARKLYQVERQKIEDEYKKSRDLVRQRLLDGLEERRRKIREDKETANDIVADTLNDVSGRSRHTRQNISLKSYYDGTHSNGESSTAAAAAAAARTEAIVKEADSLLQSFTSQNLGTALSIDNIISPLPYSLAVLPPPTQPDRVGKNARRGRNVQQPRDYDNGTPALGAGAGRDGGEGGASGDGNGGPNGAGGGSGNGNGGSNNTSSGPNNTVIRISPAMSGYAKVVGWAPGKSLEDLKTLAVASEFEREGDLANMSGWGRRGRQAGKAAAAAIAGKG
ncbi:hypothetical protein QFC21_005493 [Naganishia friedmannii]|uniref:Uncharacterized protein n=1 Tax=Naganishia friedmannii TaxID=89922 RepID=A0ACC2V9G9_9TREE|nr:hypothetical protein QFC21_005493 [Naganishia friedmannii]